MSSGNIAKPAEFQPEALLSGVQQDMIIGFKLYRNKSFLFKIKRYL